MYIFCKLFKNTFIWFIGRVTEWEGRGKTERERKGRERERERQKESVCVLSFDPRPPMATTLRADRGWSQKPGFPLCLQHGWQNTQAPCTILWRFSRHIIMGLDLNLNLDHIQSSLDYYSSLQYGMSVLQDGVIIPTHHDISPSTNFWKTLCMHGFQKSLH